MQCLLRSCKSTAVWILKARHCLPSQSPLTCCQYPGLMTPDVCWPHSRHRLTPAPGLRARPGQSPRIERRAECGVARVAQSTQWSLGQVSFYPSVRAVSDIKRLSPNSFSPRCIMRWPDRWPEQLSTLPGRLARHRRPERPGKQLISAGWWPGDHWPRRLPHVTGHIMGRGGHSLHWATG